LGRYLSKDSSREAVTARWFSSEIERARGTYRQGKRSPEQQIAVARQVCNWCDAVSASVAGIAGLQDVTKAVETLRAEAEVQTRGSFVLQLAPLPFAQISRMTCDGRVVAFPKYETPFKMSKLEIGDYEIELVHPDLGKKLLRIGAKELKDGRTYLISGKMSEASLKVSELPQ